MMTGDSHPNPGFFQVLVLSCLFLLSSAQTSQGEEIHALPSKESETLEMVQDQSPPRPPRIRPGDPPPDLPPRVPLSPELQRGATPRENSLFSFWRFFTQSGRRGTGARSSPVLRPVMLGDLPPLPVTVVNRAGTFVLPTTRTYKVAQYESPAVKDRFFVNYNVFSNLFRKSNEKLPGDLRSITVHQTTLGLERAFANDSISVGLRLPAYVVSASSSIPELNGSRSAMGDLTVLFKAMIAECTKEGWLTSGGIALTLPTGANSLFDSERFSFTHSASIQPFLAWLWTDEGLVVQSFLSVDVPVNIRNVTMLYWDVAAVLNVMDRDQGFLRKVLPTLEAHVNVPLNHSGEPGSFFDPAATPFSLNLTAGVTLGFLRGSTLLLGVVAPITQPRLMDFEILSQLRLQF